MKAWYRISPWGEERMDRRFAMLLAHLVAMRTGEKQSYDDFMLYRDEEKLKPKANLKELKAAWKSFMAGITEKKKDA